MNAILISEVFSSTIVDRAIEFAMAETVERSQFISNLTMDPIH